MQIAVDYPYRPRSRAERDRSDAPRVQQALMRLLAAGDDAYIDLLGHARRLVPNFERIAVHGALDGVDPVWRNGWIPTLDAISIYTLLARTNPRIYLEVGSGNSTKFARRAISDHGLRTKIVSIDPMPRAEIDRLCDLAIRSPLEGVDVKVFDELEAGDLMFVDCSHRSFQNSDVTVFFTEVLPMLSPGIVYGVHDVFLPCDYPSEWADRFYNEQYLLQAYLSGGAGGDTIVLPNYYLFDVATTPQVRAAVEGLFITPYMAQIRGGGAAFWMRRGCGTRPTDAQAQGAG